jgi:hypothetical protein
MHRRRIVLLALSLLALGPAACSTASGGGGGGGGGADLITRAELEDFPTLSAYEVVQRLRPRWLTRRSGSGDPVVLMDGAPMGDLSFLRTVRTSQVEEIRHMSGNDATTRYGTGYGGGTIEIRSRGG